MISLQFTSLISLHLSNEVMARVSEFSIYNSINPLVSARKTSVACKSVCFLQVSNK